MSAENAIGPVMAGTPPTKSQGVYQFPALDSSGAIVDLSGFEGYFVKLRWLPLTTGGVLLHGFFASLSDAQGGFDTTTDSSATEPATIVDNAPDWIERGSEDMRVPLKRPFLRIEASASNGTAMVRIAEG